MRLLRTATSILAFAAATSTSQAQVTVKFQSTRPVPAVTGYGYYVGRFTGTLMSDPTRPTINLYCVDVLNHVTWGQQWNASTTSLASNDFSATRHGNAAIGNYQQAAYLASMFSAPTTTTADWAPIQAAMWNLLNPGSPYGGTAESYWLTQASTWYSSAGAQSFDFSRWTIVTDVSAAGNVSGRGVQEFLTDSTVTPEPATYILLGTGLVAIAGLVAVRGKLV